MALTFLLGAVDAPKLKPLPPALPPCGVKLGVCCIPGVPPPKGSKGGALPPKPEVEVDVRLDAPTKAIPGVLVCEEVAPKPPKGVEPEPPKAFVIPAPSGLLTLLPLAPLKANGALDWPASPIAGGKVGAALFDQPAD